MAKLLVTKIFTFEAAHYLPHHKGACKHRHGHSYRLEVTVSGPIQKTGPAQGMIIDFSMLKLVVNQKIIDLYDHRDLNELFANPTAEIMIEEIAKALIGYPDFTLERIRLWETSTSYAEWQAEWGR